MEKLKNLTSKNHSDENEFLFNSKQFLSKNISIEGNIGSGKSTFIKYLSTLPYTQVYPEPVDKWRNFYGHNLLDEYYKDPKRWGFAFQMLVQQSLMQVLYTPSVQPIKIIERSIYSAKYTFEENMYKKKNISEIEHLVYTEWFNFCTSTLPIKIDLIVYIKTSPEMCFERIKARGRKEEADITMDLLNELDVSYDNWLEKKKYENFKIPILILDGNMSNTFMKNSAQELHSKLVERQPLKLLSCN